MKSDTLFKNMRKPVQWLGLLVIFALALAACTPAASTGEPTAVVPVTAATDVPAPTVAPTEVMAEEPVIEVSSNAELGEFLVDGSGMTLYMFTKDEPNKSNCAGDCLAAWPPLISQGSPVAGEGVDQSLLGTSEMPDGSLIVTYNEMPLYYWKADTKAGDVTGQNVGGVWFVVNPAGEPVGMEPAAGSDTQGSGVVVNVAENAELGEILVDENGMTLYMFANDGPNQSKCTGDCLVNWPPLLTEGDPVAGDGVEQDLLGTAELEDGSLIVTYNEMPLYYWKNDAAAGDATGQGVGEVWYVVSPAGEPVGMAPVAESETGSDGVVVNVASHPELGDILVDENGMTLYMFTRDEPDKSNCSGDCLTNWPPFVTSGDPVAGDGVDQSLLGTVELEDGSLIVTYNKMPLYYWQGDAEAGDATGQGVGEVWYVVSPAGDPIQ